MYFTFLFFVELREKRNKINEYHRDLELFTSSNIIFMWMCIILFFSD